MSTRKNAKEAPVAAVNAIEIKKPNLKTVKFPIYGTSPLICNRWSEKAKKMILDKQMKKAAKALPTKDPEADYEASLYRVSKSRYGFPAIGFKSAAVRAAKMFEIAMTDARQMFFVIPDEDDLVIINGEPSMREDMVRVQQTVDIRYRGEFREWGATLTVKFNADLISEEQLLNLFEAAGFSVGVGEWRPEKNGISGTFTLVKEAK